MQSQTESIDVRFLGDPPVQELYLTATSTNRGDLQADCRSLFQAVKEQLQQASARVFCERVFATAEAMPEVMAVRAEVFADLDDGVAPTAILVDEGQYGGFAGVQVHAMRDADSLQPLQSDCASGRTYTHNGHAWVYINSLHGDVNATPADQVRTIFQCADSSLKSAGGSFHSVARTWLWLKDICDWYDDLNAVRNDFFRKAGLIDEQRRATRLPASTGIGMYGASGAACTLDLIALPGQEEKIQFIEAGGDQRSAFEYGSAFSRASVAPMPGGPTVFVSGTAAIDPAGETEHLGRITAQVDDTIAHARSLLRQLDCDDASVLTSFIYCKTGEVESYFREKWVDLPWPRVIMIGDVCRPDLLFEVEITATPRRSTPGQA